MDTFLVSMFQEIVIFLHSLFSNSGNDRGPVLEVIVSRTNFISSHTEKKVRVVGLSTALANARDLADWLAIGQVSYDWFHVLPISRGESKTSLSASLLYIHLHLIRSHPSICDLSTTPCTGCVSVITQ